MNTMTAHYTAPAAARQTSALRPAPRPTETAAVGSYVDRDGMRTASRVGSYVSTSSTAVPAVGSYTDRGRVRTSLRRGSYTDAQR